MLAWRSLRGVCRWSETESEEKRSGEIMDGTYYENPDRQVSPVERPECPGPEPAVSAMEGDRNNSALKNASEDRTVVALDNTRECDGELPVVELTKADVHSVLKAASKEKEGCSVC